MARLSAAAINRRSRSSTAGNKLSERRFTASISTINSRVSILKKYWYTYFVTGPKTLTTYDDLSSLLTGGELYRIRRHRTLGDVLGENNESGLAGGPSVSEADEVMVLNPVTQTFLTFYFKTGGFGGTGWRSAADAVTDASGTTLYPDQGVLIVRKVAGNI